MKLLIIDDSTVNNIILQNLLEDLGYEIDTALSVKDALKKIAKSPPDLILLDLMMPDVSGFDLLNKFSKDKINIPVVVISAFNDSDYKKRALKLGARNYLLKPVDQEKLVSSIEKTLGNYENISR